MAQQRLQPFTTTYNRWCTWSFLGLSWTRATAAEAGLSQLAHLDALFPSGLFLLDEDGGGGGDSIRIVADGGSDWVAFRWPNTDWEVYVELVPPRRLKEGLRPYYRIKLRTWHPLERSPPACCCPCCPRVRRCMWRWCCCPRKCRFRTWAPFQTFDVPALADIAALLSNTK